jgi:DNA helicase-2/ATP-dependent DNA helicase PcrA
MELIKEKITYVIRGGKRFFEQQHIKDVLAHLKMIQNPRDELAFRRAVSLKNGVGAKCAMKVYELVMREGLDDTAAAKKTSSKQQPGVAAFLALRTRLRDMSQPSVMLRAVIEEYHDYAYATFEDYEDRLSSLDELVRMAERYDSLTPFTEALGLFEGYEADRNEKNLNEVIVISTIHQAKGLEWDVVFILGLNELEFPHPKSLATAHELEEERRLFYVAATRTRKRLYLLYPEMKYSRHQGPMFARPSMFLLELPAGVVDKWVVS